MRTTKYFLMAALALMTAACSNDDNDIQPPAEQPAKAVGITITAKLAPKSSAGTRAVTPGKDGENKDIIVATWAAGEHLAILYEKDGKQMADATITAVDGTTGEATITFAVEAGTADNTDCTIVYPLSAAKADKTGVKDAATWFAENPQNGTLNANLDVRVGAGKIQVTTPDLDVTTQPTAQFAIMKLTLANDAKNLSIMAGDITIAGATLASAGKEFTVAVPAVSSKTVTIVANDESNNCYYFKKTGVTIAAGKYYQSSLSMTTLDEDNNKGVYKITGSSRVTIPSGGKTVVLSGVNISSGSFSGSFTCNGSATIILMGTNTVTSTKDGKAAIQIGDQYTTLTITGSGSLTAKGCSGGAGIGTNSNSTGGNIVINGGTVTATGGDYAAGIGTGSAQNNENICGDITINGGTVNATGGYGAAGIGTGKAFNISNECGAITIGTGVTRVTATKGGADSPRSIGRGNGYYNCGTITIGGREYIAGVSESPFTYPR